MGTKAALRQWLYFRKALAPTSAIIDLPRASSLTPANLLKANSHAIRTTRPFHSTSSKQAKVRARPAPAAKRAREQKQRETNFRAAWDPMSGVAGTGLLMEPLRVFKPEYVGTMEEMLHKHETHSKWAYAAATRDGLIPSAISEKTYKDVGDQLIRAAWDSRADEGKDIIRAISTDVDAIYRIGWMVSAESKAFRQWLNLACAGAGAALPLVIFTRNTISDTHAPEHDTVLFKRLFELADHGYPPAILLQAKIMHLRGQHEASAKLLEEKVLPYLSPTARKPLPFEDICLGGLMESPYRLYALILATMGEAKTSKEYRAKADEALRVAALEYNEPAALIEYASLMMNKNNLEMYEECMSKAATQGEGSACFYLANFYYLTHQGVYPTRGEQKPTRANPDPVANWKPIDVDSKAEIEPPKKLSKQIVKHLKGLFNRSMSRAEYHRLALSWYYQAAAWNGELRASFMHALLSREMGLMTEGRQMLELSHMEYDPVYSKKVADLKANWFNKDYEPSVPKKMLPVR
ncbi:hypothetical protein N7520_010409 [Penicillium odoratum]|uniref:uncharacterized protein n=1 Tax=Penicillium odoratum TaxID=1167516 RepID=UPI002549B507|nr:uncharacterized protein N7520_010409 [Penicillium odoratum]KAJ5745227.1 hypothetical protein N7520_010409 [Penicillium odoratum]